eukprot:TRINITY_DN8416_c0_g4_i1.p1 TRINITY_DN8416_c0_g4~~TRINITY_DN8416_c0_g4_i1.p1  ORF type:complete len:597 (+),score=75.46 TRINITY_DN8416_c0_g4_i1:91-1881(+)
MAPAAPPAIAVIGAGPGGMFFCHALETRRRELEAAGDEDALRALPVVTCFDRAAGPGGVWRSERQFTSPSSGGEAARTDTPASNMYEALWTNGPKEAIEFFDYTYRDHFGDRPLPVYMPRHALLEYMIGRVTQRCPDFFDRYMKFKSSVEGVRFLSAERKFEVVITDVSTGDTYTGYYDKCIWAAGMNGRPMIPASMFNMFREGGFSGRIIHSSDTANFRSDVEGKNILLIGGSYSGEDLALMAVKCGVNKVFISSRNKNVVSWTAAWPCNKVQVLEGQVPVSVTDNGRCIQFASAECSLSDADEADNADMQTETEIRDIDTVIFCTGYSPNVNMLSEDLNRALRRDDLPEMSVPKNWKMSPNSFTDVLGDIEPADDAKLIGCMYPDLYCGCISIENPDMMFMPFEFENPLFGIDVSAWLLMHYVTGAAGSKSAEDMLQHERDAVLNTLNNPGYRCLVDKNYIDAIEKHWDSLPEKPESKHEWLDEVEMDFQETMEIRMLARYVQEANYPVSLGSVDELNETAAAYMAFDRMTRDHRAEISELDAEKGITFRDYSNGDDFVSMFTGSVASSLRKKWLDIDITDSTTLWLKGSEESK